MRVLFTATVCKMSVTNTLKDCIIPGISKFILGVEVVFIWCFLLFCFLFLAILIKKHSANS